VLVEHPACENRVMRCWPGYLSGARCRWFAYDPADANVTPIISCFIKIYIGLTFLVPAYPGCPGKDAVKRVSDCLLSLRQSLYIICLCKLDWCHGLDNEVMAKIIKFIVFVRCSGHTV